jgi:hypothetical protein
MNLKKWSTLAVAGCCLIMLAACQNQQEKVAAEREDLQEEKQDVVEATQELNEAQRAARAEWQQDYISFKRDVTAKVAANEQLILERRSEVARLAENAQEQYDDMLDDVEHKNYELRDRVNNAMDEGDVAWGQFKKDVTQAFDDLEASIKSINVAQN